MRRLSIVLILALMVVGCLAPVALAAKKQLKVVAIYTTPIEEPWDGAIHKALLRAQKELGIKYEYVEKIGPADYERVMRDYASRGYDILFLDVFAVEERARAVAKDFPNVYFVAGSGLGPQEPNFSVFDDWIHEPAYLAGMLAGKITKTNVLGVVGGYPIPEVNRLINAFIAGAKEVNPKVKVKVTFIGSWFDPPKAKEAALAQIDAGADVLYAERHGVIEACHEKGVYAIGNIVDQHDIAPDTVITSVCWDMWPTVKFVIESVQKGSWVAMDLREFSMMQKGGAYLAPFYNFEKKLPKEVIEMIKKREAEIKAGTFRVPIDESVPKSD